jgi:hypothetical protein
VGKAAAVTDVPPAGARVWGQLSTGYQGVRLTRAAGRRRARVGVVGVGRGLGDRMTVVVTLRRSS